VLQRNTTPRGSGHKADLDGRRGGNKKIRLSNIKQRRRTREKKTDEE
jgi:hypothetical protein